MNTTLAPVKSVQSQEIKLNGLGCPQCSSPLSDNVPQYEAHNHIKSMSCTNCDYIGKREGFRILSKIEIKNLSVIS